MYKVITLGVNRLPEVPNQVWGVVLRGYSSDWVDAKNIAKTDASASNSFEIIDEYGAKIFSGRCDELQHGSQSACAVTVLGAGCGCAAGPGRTSYQISELPALAASMI